MTSTHDDMLDLVDEEDRAPEVFVFHDGMRRDDVETLNTAINAMRILHLVGLRHTRHRVVQYVEEVNIVLGVLAKYPDPGDVCLLGFQSWVNLLTRALTVTLPAYPVVQRIRSKYDTAYARWPVHFNVDCFPFFPVATHEELAPRIQAALSSVAPFSIRLDSVQCFDGKKGSPGTMYAKVGDAGGGAAALHAALMAAFPQCDKKRLFQPHVTLGRFNSNVDLHSVTSALDLAWTPIEYEVTCVMLMSRSESGAFAVTHEFPLGAAPTAWRRVHVPYSADLTFGSTSVPASVSASASGSGAGLGAGSGTGSGAGSGAGSGSSGAGSGTASGTASGAASGAVSSSSATGFALGSHWVCTLRVGRAVSARKRVMNVIVVDNSSSMGRMSQEAVTHIGRGMFTCSDDDVTVVPGAVVVFSAKATVLHQNVRCAADVDALQLPSQYNTNITAGITAAVDVIVDANPPPDTHIVISFLSDGEHNEGTRLNDRILAELRTKLGTRSVTVIVVGIGMSSDTALGMQIKTALETVAVPGLDSIYFAASPSSMATVLTQLQVSLRKHASGGGAVRVRCPTHVFTDTDVHDAAVYVSAEGSAVVLLGPSKGGTADPAMPPMFVVDTEHVPVAVVEVDPTLVTEAVDAQVGRLSRLGVARGTAFIRADLDALKALIQACTDAMATTTSAVPTAWSSLRPGQRALALKAFRRSEVTFREQLNRLEELRCGVVNNSAQQAAFLTGMQRKYGAKAVRRAGVVDVPIASVMAQVADTVAAIASAGAPLPGSGDTSFMSLNTPGEQLAEWAEVDPAIIDEPYTALVSYGLCGFPVRMAHTAAVQMDPWQTACLGVEPHLIDTGSLMLANQTGVAVAGPSRETVTDAICVVHPECEAASLAAVRSVINQYLCSVTLCRDLYMYQPAMVHSMHAHAFLMAVNKYATSGGSSAYLRLALHLLYSLRVFSNGAGVYGTLLRHWLQDWGTITTATADDCKHPVQVLVALATATADDRYDYTTMSASPTGNVPLLTLLCEVVSRQCRGILRGAAEGVTAASILGDMYGINAANSPQAAADAMAPEPALAAVRRSCPPHHTLRPDAFPARLFARAASVHTWVQLAIEPYYHAFRLGHVLQKLRAWPRDSPSSAVFALQDAVAAEFATLPSDPLQFLGIPAASADRLLETMFAQGMLYNDSAERVGRGGVGVGEGEGEGEGGGGGDASGEGDGADDTGDCGLGDVRDPGCLHDLLVDVHMVHYAASCEDKRKRWLATIGDVTFGTASAATLDTFLNMVGTHTHGLSRKVFWSMLRVAKGEAARGNPSKKTAFLNRSNHTVPQCFLDKKKNNKDAASP